MTICFLIVLINIFNLITILLYDLIYVFIMYLDLFLQRKSHDNFN
jgi:uncharacterized membrane protein